MSQQRTAIKLTPGWQVSNNSHIECFHDNHPQDVSHLCGSRCAVFLCQSAMSDLTWDLMVSSAHVRVDKCRRRRGNRTLRSIIAHKGRSQKSRRGMWIGEIICSSQRYRDTKMIPWRSQTDACTSTLEFYLLINDADFNIKCQPKIFVSVICQVEM